jgi:hypothetical protein
MDIAIDFDRTLVLETPYESTAPLQLVDGARFALQSLRAADHVLLLWSARANLALLEDPMLDPLVRAGVRRVNLRQWKLKQPVHQRRYQQMLDFVKAELTDLFHAIDDGKAGKPQVDLFIDDRALRLGHGLSSVTWFDIARSYGAPVYGAK